jgi:hypothetical protein
LTTNACMPFLLVLNWLADSSWRGP